MSYEKLKEVYKDYCRNNNELIFRMAIANAMDKGFSTIKQITDDDIKEMVEGLKEREKALNEEGEKEGVYRFSVISPEANGEIVKCSRKIVDACESTIELIKFCMAEDLYDAEEYADKPSQKRVLEKLTIGINSLVAYKGFDMYDIEETFGMNSDDLEALSGSIPRIQDYLKEQENEELEEDEER